MFDAEMGCILYIWISMGLNWWVPVFESVYTIYHCLANSCIDLLYIKIHRRDWQACSHNRRLLRC